MNIRALFLKCAQAHGARPALHELETGRVATFGDLSAAITRVQAALEIAGVAGLERVALLGSADIAYLTCDYGVMAAGRVRVPLDPALSAEEQSAQLRDAGACLLIHDSAHSDRAADLARRVTGLVVREQQAFLGAADRALPDVEGPDAAMLASLSYTGGTTGSPKAVMVTHRSLTAAVQNIVLARRMAPGDILLNVRPLWPIAAVVLLAHLAAGGTVMLAARFDPRTFLLQLQSHRIAATSLVPTHLARLMDEADPAAHDLSHLRSIDVGAAAIPSELFDRLLAAFGPRFGVLYGLTEAPWSCYLPAADLDVEPDTQRLRMRSVGRALAGVEVRIRAPDGTSAATGEVGEVTLRGEHLMAGYWNRPEATAEALREGWFHTGDLGSVDADGYLFITGRIKELIRTGGRSVVPAEVEAVLMAHPAVADAVVLGLQDAEWGEIVAAAVVLRPAAEDIGEAQLIDWCRERLSGFKKPRRVFVVATIARSHYGKPLRARMRDELQRLN